MPARPTASTPTTARARRLGRSTVITVVIAFEYDGDQMAQESNNVGALLRRYVYGVEPVVSLVMYDGSGTTAKTWLHRDQLGSVIATASSEGTRKDIYTYCPFGEPDKTTGVRFRYTGQWLIGELGLYYYKARFYSPELGRFLQTDPIGYKDDLNLYAYVKNDPINFTDPTGLASDQQGNWVFASSGQQFRVVGGTLAEQKTIAQATRDVLGTSRGQDMLTALQGRGQFDINVAAESSAFFNSNAIDVNPSATEAFYRSDSGYLFFELPSKIGHEMGHAVFGTQDNGPGRMNNVYENENPIRLDLGLPMRRKY